MHELTTHARAAIDAGTFDTYRTAVLAGATPGPPQAAQLSAGEAADRGLPGAHGRRGYVPLSLHPAAIQCSF